MRVVDTSAWIEWLLDSSCGARIASLLPSRTDWIVPTIVQLELTKWLKREVGDDEVDAVMAFTQKCRVVPLDTTLALAAADIGSRLKLATADAIVYATAQAHGASVLTCDSHFKDLENVEFVSKRSV